MTGSNSDPGTAIRAALDSAKSEFAATRSVWIRFRGGDYCLIEKDPNGWSMECDCGAKVKAEELEVEGEGEIVMTASSAKHPVVIRMAFPSDSVNGVFIRTNQGQTVPLMEVSA